MPSFQSVSISRIHIFFVFSRLLADEHGAKDFDVIDSLKEAVEICDTALRSVQRQRFWYIFFSCILFIPLIWSIGLNGINMSLGINIGLDILRIFFTVIWCYILFMSSIWNSVEQNALKAGCLAIKIYLTKFDDDRN